MKNFTVDVASLSGFDLPLYARMRGIWRSFSFTFVVREVDFPDRPPFLMRLTGNLSVTHREYKYHRRNLTDYSWMLNTRVAERPQLVSFAMFALQHAKPELDDMEYKTMEYKTWWSA